MYRSVSKETKDLLLFKMPMQEAVFFENMFDMYIPS